MNEKICCLVDELNLTEKERKWAQDHYDYLADAITFGIKQSAKLQYGVLETQEQHEANVGEIGDTESESDTSEAD